MSLLGPKGKKQLLRQVPEVGLLEEQQAEQEVASGAVGDGVALQAGSLSPSPQGDKSPSRRRTAVSDRKIAATARDSAAQGETSAVDPQVDKGTSPHDNKPLRPLSAKHTDYTKKGYYLGLRHQEILDDLARELRRRGLPDDRSMIVRALLDAAKQRLQDDGGTWVDQLAAFCLATLPGTTKNGRARG